MSIIANLDINLRGNTSGIEKGADVAKKAVGSARTKIAADLTAIETRFTGMGNHVKLVAGGMGKALALATGGLTLLTGALAGFVSVHGILEATDALDSLGDSATKIGIGTEALAGFRHAANLTGVSAESLDKALVKMQKNLADAAAGGGKAAGALADLGLDAAILKDLGPEEAFQKITQKINEIPNAADQAAVSMEIFGKAGAELIPLIAESGELGAKIKEASELGLSATQAQVAEVGAANDAIDTMKSAFKGLFRTVAIALAPFVEGFAEGVTSAIKYLNSFRDSLVRIFRQVQFVLENFGEYWDLTWQYALYKVVSFGNDIENLFTSVIPTTFMEGVKLITPAWDYLTDYIAYKLTQITNVIIDKAKRWANVIEKAIQFDFAGTGNAIAEALAGGDRQEGEIEKMLRQDSERSASRLDKLMGESAKKIGEAFNRSEGPIEAAMRQSVEGKSKRLADRMNQFVDEKMTALTGKKKKAGGEEDEFARSGKGHDLDNKAVERGTQEALKLVSGKSEDKTLKKMDEQLVAANKQIQLLKDIAKKPGLARANV